MNRPVYTEILDHTRRQGQYYGWKPLERLLRKYFSDGKLI